MDKKIINKKSVKGNAGKLLEGALVGAALGVAAGILLTSKSGKKMQNDIKKLSADFYHYLTPQVKKLKQVGEAQFNAFVAEGVKKYAKVKKLSLAQEKVLAKEAKHSWSQVKKHLS